MYRSPLHQRQSDYSSTHTDFAKSGMALADDMCPLSRHSVWPVWMKTRVFRVCASPLFATSSAFAYASVCLTLRHLLSSFCTDENNTEILLQECTCCAINWNSCESCVHRSRVKEPLARMSAMCLEVLTYLIWIPGSRFSGQLGGLARWIQEIRLTVGLQPVLIIERQRDGCSLTGDVCFWRTKINDVLFPSRPPWEFFFCSGLVLRRNFSTLAAPTHQPRCPTHWAQEFLLISDQHPMRWVRLRCCCETAVCFLQVQLIGTNVFPKIQTRPLTLTWSPSGHLESRRPGKDRGCTLQCFPRDNIFCYNLCNGCGKSIWPDVNQRLCSIWRWLLPSNSQTIKCQAWRCEPHTSTSGRCVNKLLTISPTVLQCFLFDLMIIHTKCGDFEKLLNFLFC